MVLYVLGNGFDRAHGMSTSYLDFEEFVDSNHADKKIKYDDQYITDNLWRSFEEKLADLDITMLLSSVDGIFDLGENEDGNLNIWGDRWFKDVITNRLVSADVLKDLFAEWVGTIKIPTGSSKQRFNFSGDKENLYVNFNYTNVLQKLYRIDEGQIFHIHGSADIDSSIIVGHGEPYFSDRSTTYIDEEGNEVETDEVDLSPYAETGEKKIMLKSMVSYLNALKKPTDIAGDGLSDFLNQKITGKTIEKVCIFGHSCGSVDIPYLSIIQSLVGIDTKWEIAYHNIDSIDGIRQRLITSGFCLTNTTFVSDKDVSYNKY